MLECSFLLDNDLYSFLRIWFSFEHINKAASPLFRFEKLPTVSRFTHEGGVPMSRLDTLWLNWVPRTFGPPSSLPRLNGLKMIAAKFQYQTCHNGEPSGAELICFLDEFQPQIEEKREKKMGMMMNLND